MKPPTTFRRLFFTTTVVALCAMAGALLAGRALARRLAAERVAEVLVEAIPTQGLAACSAGNPQRTITSERLEFAYYSASGVPLSPGAPAVPAPLLVRIGEGRTAASASNAEAKMLLRLDATAGDCAFALATWRFQGQNRATAGGALIAVLSVLLALLLGAGTLIAIRPLAAQLRELQRSARSLARRRIPGAESSFLAPEVIFEEAREVAQRRRRHESPKILRYFASGVRILKLFSGSLPTTSVRHLPRFSSRWTRSPSWQGPRLFRPFAEP